VNKDFIPFPQFFEDVFVPLNKLELPIKPLHRDTCRVLQKAFFGELKKNWVVINVPPRVGKTKMVEAWVAWAQAYFPDSQFIQCSYSNTLAEASCRYIQQTMDSPWYRELFPHTRLGGVRQAGDFNTTEGGRVYADGVGGSLTGVGAGLKRPCGGAIILDDPSKPDEALSRVESDKLRVWLENTLKSRRNSSQYCPIIVVMQRLHPDDLSGFILQNYPDDVEHIKFPALVNGESAIPETVSTKDLLDTQRVNPFTFAAQYLQDPIIQGGNLIKLDNFRYYDFEAPPKIELKIITCDTAMKARESSDYSVLQCWGRSLKRACLIDQIRGKWAPAELLANSRKFYEKHHKATSPLSYIAVEEAGTGYGLMLEMRKKGIPARGITRLTDKVSRVKMALPYQETGMVFLPKGAPWLPLFEQEIAMFQDDGKQRHDDQCDCFADAVTLLLSKGTSILNVLGNDRRKK
jgi:predicted phage terminase large subunit-like protein